VRGFLTKALGGGVALVAMDDKGAIRTELHASHIGPKQFDHVLSGITVAVHPLAQREGLARALFEAMFDAAKSLTPAVTRFELMVREGNTHAIRLYERLGFKIEGRFEKRVRLEDGTLEEDVVMGNAQQYHIRLDSHL
jgi:putative acetyltransferase